MFKQPTASSLAMAEAQRQQNKKMCECGHVYGEHEKMKKSDGKEIRPCVKFIKKPGELVNASVCSCKNFTDV